MRRLFSIFLFFLCIFQFPFCKRQPPQSKQVHVKNPAFEKKLLNTLSFSVPLYSVDDLFKKPDHILLLDTREDIEFETSHIPGAVHAGYSNFDISQFETTPKDTTIVLYCSVGYRSEKIGEKLKNAGFNHVYNLYGSIFEWTNSGYPLVKTDGNKTDKIHTYNKRWAQWVDNLKISKVH